jgi:trimethylamine--corrinoid protein Co-methyltransferase
MPGIDRTGLKDARLSTLTEAETERIHEGALRVLEKTGIVLHDDGILALLGEAGCPADGETRRVRLPPAVVNEAVSRAPAVVGLYNRVGEQVMALGGGSFHARTSSGATGVLDLRDGRRRAPTVQDAVDAVRLADALPHIHGVSAMAVQPADLPVGIADLQAVRIALANTVKPLGYVCLNEHLVDAVVGMAEAVAGGQDALRRRPILTALAESTSPLQFVSGQLTVLRAFASRGLPLTLHAHPIAGFTAPVTLAGELVITHAEILALVTMAQLIRPGTPVVYGMSSSVPDMCSGANLSGAVEIGLLGAAVACLSHRCGLPCVVSTGTDAHAPGAQSVLERMMTLWPVAMAGVDLVNLTTLETKMSFCPEQLVIDETILSAIERYARGIGVDGPSLALDLIHHTGPGGAFVTADHTLDHHRSELAILDLIGHEPRDNWERAGAPSLVARAREKAGRILAEHRPPALPETVAAQLDEIAREAETRLPSR